MTLPNERENKGPHLPHATLTISGSNVNPDFWTSYFKISPDLSVTKGQKFKTPSERLSSIPAQRGVWGLYSRGAIHDAKIDRHVNYIVSKLSLPRGGLAALISSCQAKMSLVCFWPNYLGESVLIVSKDLRDLIEEAGGQVDIDEYPQKHRLISNDGTVQDFWV